MTVLDERSAKVYIPTVDKAVLTERSNKVRAVVTFGSTKHFIKPVDIFGIAYTWEPKKGEKAKGLKPLKDVITFHSYGAPVFFKPSIAECLAQIPDDVFDQVVAFEIIEVVDDNAAMNAGYHAALTRFYGKE